jgi:hypothetical protein
MIYFYAASILLASIFEIKQLKGKFCVEDSFCYLNDINILVL